MQRRTALVIVAMMLALAASACNLYPGVPATPTLIPTYETPTPTPTALIGTRAVALPSRTVTPSATSTPTHTPTLTPSLQPSLTASSTPTNLPTLTLTASASMTASVTPVIATQTFTTQPPTLTVTPRPTETATVTSTLTASAVPSSTLLPPTASLTPTTSTRLPPVAITVTNPPTITIAPTVAPLPITFTPLPVALVASQTPRPTASQAPATLERPIIVITSTPRPQSTATLGTPIPVPGATFTPIFVSSVPTAGFEQLPNGQTRIAGNLLQPPIRDAQGQLVADFDISPSGRQVIINLTGQATIDGVPYVGDDKHTRQRFVFARWSPDGRYLAYIVQRDGAETGTLSWADTIDDGVWVLDSTPGSKPKHIYLNTYIRDSNEFPYRVAVGLAWANDSYALLITVNTVAGQSTILAGINGEMQPFPTAPGTWLLDNSGWVATQAENGNVTLGVMNRNGGFAALLNSLQAGVWMQNPAQVADGRYAFLGKPALSGQLEGGATNLQLYVFAPGETPVAVSAPIAGEVVSAEWSPNRAALLVHVRTQEGIQVVVMTLDGVVTDYTAYANGASGSHWLR